MSNEAAIAALTALETPEAPVAAETPANTETSDKSGVKTETDESKKSAEENKPPEDPSEELIKISQHRAALDKQIQTEKRIRETNEKRTADIARREKELTSLVSLSDAERYIAKSRGITVEQLRSEYAEELKNGGKSSGETQTKRELEEIKRKLQESDKSREEHEKQLEAQKRQEQFSAWGHELETALFVEGKPTELMSKHWARLAAAPPAATLRLIGHEIRAYVLEHGELPEAATVAQILGELDREFPEVSAAPAKPNSQPPKPKPKVVSGKDADTSSEKRILTEDERRAAAIAKLAELDTE